MKTILVPIDFSASSRNSFCYALELASRSNAEVILFNVFFPVMSPPATYEAADVIVALEEGKVKELELFSDASRKGICDETRLQAAATAATDVSEKIAALDKVKVRCVAKMGGSYEKILEAITQYQVDLVVMGMQTGEAVSQAILGSTTISVMQESQVPVLAIPQGVTFRSFKSVVFAINLRKLPATADLHLLRDFVKMLGAKLEVLHLYRTNEQYDKFNAQPALEALAANLEGIAYDVSFDICPDVAAGIQEFIREQEADLLVMIPQKHNFFERLLDKSITGQITAHPLVPLLALPSGILEQLREKREESAPAVH